MPPKVVYIEGLIGAGKSTLLKALSSTFAPDEVRVIYEPVAEWEKSGILKLFYSDIKRWAYTFQTYVYVTRIQAILKEIESMSCDEYQRLKFIFVERSVFSDKFFFMKNLEMSGDVNEVECHMYNMWWDMYIQLLPCEFTHDHASFIYLKPSMDKTMERVRKRARDGEETVGEQYQRSLQRVHDEFFTTHPRVVQVETNAEVSSSEVVNLIIQNLEKMNE
jgi:deoxyadenosine/deoxycytidine kinase